MSKLAAIASLTAIGFMLFSHHDYAATARTSVAGAFSSVAGVLNQGPVALPLPTTASTVTVHTAAASAPAKH
jgi:hypothetical protein